MATSHGFDPPAVNVTSIYDETQVAGLASHCEESELVTLLISEGAFHKHFCNNNQ